MKTNYFHIVVAVWLFAVVPFGHAADILPEAYPSRETLTNMNQIVSLGTRCARGVNERCWATQYSTNPVQYYVAPFTNNSCWYLDQSLMGQMASKARSLVPYYANTNTVYDGTTNITMLAVTSLWAQLQIGDRTNQFTCVPANGTNAATYGDYPGWIYKTDLEERYKVLNALKITKTSTAIEHQTKEAFLDYVTLNWDQVCSTNEAAFLVTSTNGYSYKQIIYGGLRYYAGGYRAHIVATRSKVSMNIFSTNLLINETFAMVYPVSVEWNDIGSGDWAGYTNSTFTFDDNGLGLEYGKWNIFSTTTNSYFGTLALPTRADEPILGESVAKGFAYTFQSLIDWDFQYCNDE